ncbi:MAG: tetratricopeptide repeat protein [Candidatus Sericytochromatia bacterium]|nr:tetratricopeptide repeat protein [Candidatus Sericytochromatia bacterium]
MSKTKSFAKERGYYEILETSPTATTNEIQRSFERIFSEKINIGSEDINVRKSSAELLFTITKAYDILTDPFQRLSYDERRFGGKPQQNNEVETIFKEGLRAFRSNQIETALKFFKESVTLYPHKTMYRVNLAIAYAEKGMVEDAKKELRMSLRLDPENDFAQEVIAKILFKVSDKKSINFLSHKVNRQLVLVGSGFALAMVLLIFGMPKINGLLHKTSIANNVELEKQHILDKKNQLPQDLRDAIDKHANTAPVQTKFSGIVPKLDDNFKISGQAYDYSTQTATKKTYNKDQGMVMVEYSNGSILTYKLQDLQGWNIDSETKTPVVITKGNEIIPVQTNIPVTLSDGRVVKPSDPDFPVNAFPEYNLPPVKVEEAVTVAPPVASIVEPSANTLDASPTNFSDKPSENPSNLSIPSSSETLSSEPRVTNFQGNKIGAPKVGLPPTVGRK